MNTRQEVWTIAQQTGMDEFISKVSSVFGKGAEVAIETGGVVYETRDGLMDSGQDRVVPGTGATERRLKPNRELNEVLKECREFSKNPKRRTLHRGK